MSGLLGLGITKRRVFVSYHHADRYYYEQLAQHFRQFDFLTNRSLEESIDSYNDDYVYRAISERYITGSSCTIVLCGEQTWGRKHVDWEIKATLDKEHGLVGVRLPARASTLLTIASPNAAPLPWRLFDNLAPGFALLLNWQIVVGNAFALPGAIGDAVYRDRSRIQNNREMMGGNIAGS